MNSVLVKRVSIGSELARRVLHNKQVIFPSGTVITQTVKDILLDIGVERVYVNTIMDERMDHKLKVEHLNKLTVDAIRSLNIDDMLLCSKILVNSITEGSVGNTITTYIEDDITYNHSLNVANLAVTCGVHMGLHGDDIKTLAIGSLLHDIGKYKIDPNILNKPGKLTSDEFEDIKLHPGLGYGMLIGRKDIPKGALDIVLQHHENWDGSGYPQGLKGRQVNKLARIVHVADVYEAICSKRPYKDVIGRKEARAILQSDEGVKFDPIILKHFLNSIPLYAIGEEIVTEDGTGTVCTMVDDDEAIVRFGDNFKRVRLA